MRIFINRKHDKNVYKFLRDSIKILIVSSFVIFFLTSCMSNARQKSGQSAADERRAGTASGFNAPIWYSPVLKKRSWRTRFCCYNTVYYRLVAEPSIDRAIPKFIVLIDANYGGNVRQYELVHFPDATSRRTQTRTHEVERCQIFGRLNASCLYHDRLSVPISYSDLLNAQSHGLKMTLGSTNRNYESIDVPAEFIRNFLSALR